MACVLKGYVVELGCLADCFEGGADACVGCCEGLLAAVS